VRWGKLLALKRVRNLLLPEVAKALVIQIRLLICTYCVTFN